MEARLAQMVALTCFGNAALRSYRVSDFFHENPICRFCESIVFKTGLPSSRGEPLFTTIALDPDQWFDSVLRHGGMGLRLRQKTRNNPLFPGSLTSGKMAVRRVRRRSRGGQERLQSILSLFLRLPARNRLCCVGNVEVA